MSRTQEGGWRFAARDSDGKVLSGVVQAASETDARKILVGRQLNLLTLEPPAQVKTRWVFLGVDPDALSVFTRQFATLVDAALPLLSVLEMLAELTTDRALKAALVQVRKEVNGGSSLSDALRMHPRVFGSIYVFMVEAGEIGGTLPESLTRLADYMERAQEIRRRLMGALIYPSVVLAVAVCAVGIILAFVVPVFSDLYASEGLELPFSTRLLLASSAFLTNRWQILLLVAAAAAFAARGLLSGPGGRRWLDRVVNRLPLVGNLTRKAAVARLTRAMASMVHSGVPLSDTLLASARISGNTEVEEAVLQARGAVHAGSDLSTPLSKSIVLPPLLAQMVHVGEESGRLEEMLDKVADFYDMEVKTAIDGAMKALEPTLIVFLGALLGGMIVAMYTPIFDLMTSLA